MNQNAPTADKTEDKNPEQGQLMEQYKVYLQMLDSSNQQRMTTNQFFLALHTFLVTLFIGAEGYMFASGKGHLLLMVLFAYMGYHVSRVWYFLLANYNTINSARWKVVNEIEEKFLCKNKPFYSEWRKLKEETDIPKGLSWLCPKSDASSGGDAPKPFYSISRIESKLPKLFGIMYIALGGITALIWACNKWILPNSCKIRHFCENLWQDSRWLVIVIFILVAIVLFYVIPIKLPNKRKKSEEEPAEDS